MKKLKKLTYVASGIFYLCLSYLPQFLRRLLNFTVKSRSPDKHKKRSKLCIFASWAPTGKVPESTLHYIKSLADLGFDCVFVTTADTLSKESVDSLSEHCRKVVHRKNHGYDFYSWKVGLASVPDVDSYESLLFANDSVFGPFKTLEPFLKKMDASPNKIWGFTDSEETGQYHIQSYFIYTHRTIFLRPEFKAFWNSVRIHLDKWKIIQTYEIGFSQKMIRAGIEVAACIPIGDVVDAIKHRFPNFQYLRTLSKQLNPTLFLWDILVREFSFPFIKSDLLKTNRISSASLHEWPLILGQSNQNLANNIIDEIATLKFQPSKPSQLLLLIPIKNWLRPYYNKVRQIYQENSGFKEISRAVFLLLLKRLPNFIPNQTNSAKKAFLTSAKHQLSEFFFSDAKLVFPSARAPKVTIMILLFNKAELTYLCLRSLLTIATELDEGFEILIIDNKSTDETHRMLSQIEGCTILKNKSNVGFLRGCNEGAKHVKTEYLLFLNNDTIVHPGTLKAAIDHLDNTPKTGAIGARVILPDGTLQEAGCFIWQDGSCHGFARGRSSQYGPAMYRRKVDYCSGAFLMTRLSLFKEIGGFDERYIPAYYEETDYCVEIQKRGFDVVYDPRVAIDHFEFGSSHADSNAFNQMTINQVKFREKHQDFLSGKQPPKPSPSRALSSGHISKRRVLFIDDMVANVFIGAGYPRTNFIINYFHDLGWSISLYATQEIETKRWHEYYLDISQTIEIIAGDIDLHAFLNEFISEYDLVWVSRPSNMKRFVEFMKGADSKLKPKIVYDSEAIFAERGLLECQITGSQPSALSNLAYLDEIGNGSMADHIISVSERDAKIWRVKAQKPVSVVGHTVDLKPTSNSYNERKGFVFLGSLHQRLTPNTDSLEWFLECCFGRIQLLLGFVPQFTIVGFISEDVRKHLRERYPFLLILGKVEDISHSLNQSRVMVVPTRFAAGMPQKVFDAACLGVPTVCSPLIGSQMSWTHDRECLIAPIDNGRLFAEQCVRLYSDALVWESVRDNALDSMRKYKSNHEPSNGILKVLADLKLDS